MILYIYYTYVYMYISMNGCQHGCKAVTEMSGGEAHASFSVEAEHLVNGKVQRRLMASFFCLYIYIMGFN